MFGFILSIDHSRFNADYAAAIIIIARSIFMVHLTMAPKFNFMTQSLSYCYNMVVGRNENYIATDKNDRQIFEIQLCPRRDNPTQNAELVIKNAFNGFIESDIFVVNCTVDLHCHTLILMTFLCWIND